LKTALENDIGRLEGTLHSSPQLCGALGITDQPLFGVDDAALERADQHLSSERHLYLRLCDGLLLCVLAASDATGAA